MYTVASLQEICSICIAYRQIKVLSVVVLLCSFHINYANTRHDAGATGEPGADGPQGPQGEKGGQGDIGPAGSPGMNGLKGMQGVQGEKGMIGDPGPTGNDGQDGSVGPSGQKGGKGDIGLIGPQGNDGPHGEKGSKGDSGDLGEQGMKGEQGDHGEPGERGASGVDGADGQAGIKGDAGQKGESGDAGMKGVWMSVALLIIHCKIPLILIALFLYKMAIIMYTLQVNTEKLVQLGLRVKPAHGDCKGLRDLMVSSDPRDRQVHLVLEDCLDQKESPVRLAPLLTVVVDVLLKMVVHK